MKIKSKKVVFNKIYNRLKYKLYRSYEHPPAGVISIHDPSYICIFYSLRPFDFSGPGKVSVEWFFPSFCAELADRNVQCVFAFGERNLLRKISQYEGYRLVIVCIYSEEYADNGIGSNLPRLPEFQAPILVFNDFAMGEIIGSKSRTRNLLLSKAIPIVPLYPNDQGMLFSLPDTGSSEVAVIVKNEQAAPNRFNSKFVDTRFCFKGISYYTTVRLLTVCGNILHAYVRCRPADENPSVHAKDTPRDRELIECLQDGLIAKHFSVLESIAEDLGCCLGPGFYAHDLLFDVELKQFFVCETGYKFNDYAYTHHLNKTLINSRAHSWAVTDEFPRKSASLFCDYVAGEPLK